MRLGFVQSSTSSSQPLPKKRPQRKLPPKQAAKLERRKTRQGLRELLNLADSVQVLRAQVCYHYKWTLEYADKVTLQDTYTLLQVVRDANADPTGKTTN